jgi:DNA-binding winged helix-turn-helix (wHTH) protein/tetratricopeptide (TPR) repeat protein
MNESRDRELYRVGDLTLDVEARLLTRAGTLVPLPPKTFELLVELVRRAPGVVRRQELLDTVWAHELVNDEALTQRVMLLRRALEDDPKEPKFIASAPRWGYRLVAPVERVHAKPAATGASMSQPSGASSDRLRALLVATRTRFRHLLWITSGLAAVLAVAAGTVFLNGRHHSVASVAITSFRATEGAEGDVGYLCEGIPATVTRTLSLAVPELTVRAASAPAPSRGGTPDPRTIGQHMGVRAVLTGTLARHGGVLTIETQLWDAENGNELWAAHIERPATDILAVQDEISGEIVKGLRLRLTGEERDRLARRPTENIEAYNLYLKGRYYWNKRAERGFHDAMACFKAALDEDPSYALAWTGLADCFALEGSMEYGIAPPRDVMPKAKTAAETALKFDPDLAEAHASLGLVLWQYEWRRDVAEHELRTAIEKDPRYAPAYQWLAEMLAEQGRPEEAERELRRALEVEPLSLVINVDRGWFSYYQRDYEPAIQYYRETLAMEPNFVQARLGLGLAYAQQGEHAKAIETLEEANRLVGGIPPTMSALGYAYGLAGRKAEAQAVLDELLALSKQHYVSSFYVAGVLVGMSNRDRGFEWLGRACEERASLLGALRVWPAFDPLRDDPRFTALLRCAGLAR